MRKNFQVLKDVIFSNYKRKSLGTLSIFVISVLTLAILYCYHAEFLSHFLLSNFAPCPILVYLIRMSLWILYFVEVNYQVINGYKKLKKKKTIHAIPIKKNGKVLHLAVLVARIYLVWRKCFLKDLPWNNGSKNLSSIKNFWYILFYEYLIYLMYLICMQILKG